MLDTNRAEESESLASFTLSTDSNLVIYQPSRPTRWTHHLEHFLDWATLEKLPLFSSSLVLIVMVIMMMEEPHQNRDDVKTMQLYNYTKLGRNTKLGGHQNCSNQ